MTQTVFRRLVATAAALPLLLVPLFTSAQTANAPAVTAPQLDGATLRSRLAPSWAAPAKPMPADAQALDTMLSNKQFKPLTERLQTTRDASAVGLDLNWEQEKVFGGGGFLISYAYMFDLWRLGSALPAPGGDQIRQSAAMMLLYNLDLIAVDGLKCADPSAPSHRRDQLLAQNQALIHYMQGLPRETRMTLGTVSLAVEAATAAVRTNDEVLCSGGLAEINHDLEVQGDKPLAPAPATPGTIGKTYLLPTAPDYRPRFLAPAAWAPKQTALRPTLAAGLTRLLTLPSDAPATAAPPTAPAKPKH